MTNCSRSRSQASGSLHVSFRATITGLPNRTASSISQFTGLLSWVVSPTTQIRPSLIAIAEVAWSCQFCECGTSAELSSKGKFGSNSEMPFLSFSTRDLSVVLKLKKRRCTFFCYQNQTLCGTIWACRQSVVLQSV